MFGAAMSLFRVFVTVCIVAGLSTIIIADDSRHVQLNGQSNFRDVGGYRTSGGKTVKRGLVYRSGELSRLIGLVPPDHPASVLSVGSIGPGRTNLSHSAHCAARTIPAVEASTSPAQRGSQIVTVVPMSSSLSIVTVPACCWTMSRTNARPWPVPRPVVFVV